MLDKQIKIWISTFVFTLTVVGGGVSFFATRGKTFYKGMEKQVSSVRYQVSAVQDAAKTSVLHMKKEKEEKREINIKYQVSAVTSPCSNGEILVIKNGQVAGCSSREKKEKKIEPQPQTPVKISAPPPPGPKVKILKEPSVEVNASTNYKLPTTNFSSCESKDSFTYTGPDRPGLLYGMCIDCETNNFIIYGGKC